MFVGLLTFLYHQFYLYRLLTFLLVLVINLRLTTRLKTNVPIFVNTSSYLETINYTMNVLQIENVVKTYETKKAVNSISLQVPEQSIFGLLGPNGAGKTTLIRMITNIIYPDSGSITLSGIPKGINRNQYIGYMPEERGLYKKMKVGEQLFYLAQLKGLSRKKAKEQIDYWLEKFAITDWWSKKVSDLSKGMQQKIQFIATVIHQPKLVILDEPFSGLDPVNTNLIKDEIFELKSKGMTILFSTHRMEQVEEICEYIALVNSGKIVLEGKVKSLKERFKKHLFSVDYIGQLPAFSPKIFTVLQEENQHLTIKVKNGYSSNDVLQELLHQQVQIQSFQEILPSLNEIFITETAV